MSRRPLSLKTTPLQCKQMPSFIDFSPKSQQETLRKNAQKRTVKNQKPQSKITTINEENDDFMELFDIEGFRQAKKRKLKEKGNKIKKTGNIHINDFDPVDIDELAVNPKKVKEVREWIESKMSTDKKSKLLFITGPCGSGKTATVKALGNELNLEVIEIEHHDGENDQDNFIFEKGDKDFYSFIKSCEYSSIETSKKTNRLIIIEHLPTVFYSNPNRLKEILENFTSTRIIIVIIMSTIENCWDLSPMRILPESTQEVLGMTHIKFNAIAQTYMRRALGRIFQICEVRTLGTCLDEIVISSDGDIRAALNSIKFSSTERKLSKKITTAINHLSTFHFVGKIMHSKRAESSSKEWRMAENKLECKRLIRPKPPKDDINYLVEVSRFSETKLSDYVFEHEPNFFPSMKAGARVMKDLCEMDSIVNQVEYQMKNVIDHYSVEVTIRSTFFNNYDFSSNGPNFSRKGMYSFQKPKIWDLRNAINDKKVRLLKTLPRMRSSDLFTTTVPLILSVKFELMPEERVMLESLSLRSIIAMSKSSNLIKINPRPIKNGIVGKNSERQGIYLNPVKLSKCEIDIEETSDVEW